MHVYACAGASITPYVDLFSINTVCVLRACRAICFAPFDTQATSGAEVRVATEKSMTKDSQERIVYIKGTPFQREKALDMIRSNPKVR